MKYRGITLLTMTSEQRLTNEQDWRKRISDWKTSGISRQEFCRNRNITLSAFQYWSKRLKQTSQVPKHAEPVKLARLIARDVEPSRKLIVRVGTVCIDVEAGFDPATLRALIDVLADREAL